MTCTTESYLEDHDFDLPGLEEQDLKEQDWKEQGLEEQDLEEQDFEPQHLNLEEKVAARISPKIPTLRPTQ